MRRSRLDTPRTPESRPKTFQESQGLLSVFLRYYSYSVFNKLLQKRRHAVLPKAVNVKLKFNRSTPMKTSHWIDQSPSPSCRWSAVPVNFHGLLVSSRLMMHDSTSSDLVPYRSPLPPKFPKCRQQDFAGDRQPRSNISIVTTCFILLQLSEKGSYIYLLRIEICGFLLLNCLITCCMQGSTNLMDSPLACRKCYH